MGFHENNSNLVSPMAMIANSTMALGELTVIIDETTTAVSAINKTCFSEIHENFSFRAYPILKNFEGDLDLEYVKRINPFWLQFDAPTENDHLVMAIIYIIMCTVGCSGNFLVLYLFVRCKSLRTPANTLVINLTVSDFCMLLKGPILIYNSFKKGPALGDIGCRLYGFIGGLVGVVSIMTLAAVAVDRYHVIVYPLDPLKSTTKNRVRLMILFIWIYSLTFAIIPALEIHDLSVYVPEGYLTACSFDYLSKAPKSRIFMFIFFIAGWCVPFLIITYCYFYILKVVISANSIQSSKDKNKTEFKLSFVVIAIIGLWFIAWTPYAIVALIGISGHEELLTPTISMVPAIFCKSSACINPYIYALTHPRYRMEFRRIFLGQEIRRRFSSTMTMKSSTRRNTVKDKESILLKKFGATTEEGPATVSKAVTNLN